MTHSNLIRPANLAVLVAAAMLAALTGWALAQLLPLGLSPGELLLPMTGAVTLVQAALLSQDDLQAGVLETFVQESVILDRLPLMDIEGNAFAYNEEAALPAVEFRAVNASYAESTGTVVQKSEKLVILGGDSDLDTFIQATRSNLNNQRSVQDAMKVKAAVYKFQDAFINGDSAVDANSFDGLKKRLVGGQVLVAGTNGLPIIGNAGTDIHAFFDFLDSLIAAVPGLSAGNGALVMNNLVRSKILAALRRININIEPVGRLPEPLRQSTVGRPIPDADLPTYNGIPLIDIGTKADGTLIIPQTETTGASSITSSIYAVRFGESEADQSITGLYNTQNGAVNDRVFRVTDLGEQQAKPAYRTRIEGFIGLGSFGGKSAARGQGVLNS